MKLRFNSTGTDAVFLANANMFLAALFGLELFTQRWPEDRFGSRSVLQNDVDWYRQMFEGGLTGNRFHIAARRTARNGLKARIQDILQYVGVMANEKDISLMLSCSAVSVQSQKRARKSPKPSTTSA